MNRTVNTAQPENYPLAESAPDTSALTPSPPASSARSPGASRGYIRLALSYWTGDDRRTAWPHVIFLALLLAGTLAVNLGYNYWNKVFFDAVGKKEPGVLWSSLFWLPVITLAGAGLAALTAYVRVSLQARWREFVSGELLSLWLSDQRYYRLAMVNPDLANVEQRIAEDVRLTTEPTVDLTVGLVWSISSALSFIGVLLWVGGGITVGGVTIPGYLAFAAVLYAICVSGGALWIGRHLSRVIGAKNEMEAQFRYEMTRVRENSESIAFIHGDARERETNAARLADVRQSWLTIAFEQARITVLLNANSFFAPAVPAVLAAPKYFSGELSLGSLMQVIAAFGAVLSALNWIADNFIRLSEVRASVERAANLHAALVDLDGGSSLAVKGRGGHIELRNVTLRTGDGRQLVGSANVLVMPGERVMIEGKSGSGKSSLLRLMAGLWPWADGAVYLPDGGRIEFVPQKPYVPIGTLRDALTYPDSVEITDEQARAALHDADLATFVERLDERANWERLLSGGERQRLAFARLFLKQPEIIVMDEATSALDDVTQDKLFARLIERAPRATILSVAHRQGLERFHDRKVKLESGTTRSIIAGSGSDALRRLANNIRRVAKKKS